MNLDSRFRDFETSGNQLVGIASQETAKDLAFAVGQAMLQFLGALQLPV